MVEIGKGCTFLWIPDVVRDVVKKLLTGRDGISHGVILEFGNNEKVMRNPIPTDLASRNLQHF
ncbi:hypothetical protein GCM10007416_32620 [Kroppenstedtia guangzhouensis]|jgi:hypothetical protein|uniref:Uncharacterized protein n=1 Tax=Kroppenstedtia guangzhouensis TaxID=1274356 RepID=A0ABQ1H2U6_9BACL|nr:hypothetical protein GCM10007416_32620 [Kroppenstedtia guangzhouensis]